MNSSRIWFGLAALVLFGAVSVSAQTPPTSPADKGKLISCSGSPELHRAVSLQMSVTRTLAAPGAPFLFRGTIKNDGADPLADLGVLVRILKDHPRPNAFADTVVVDEFYLDRGFALAPQAERNISGSWLVSPALAAGRYKALFYAVSGGKLAVGGFPADDFAPAAALQFTVAGSKILPLYLDRGGVKVRGKSFSFKNAAGPFPVDAPITVSVPLLSQSAGNVLVTYRLFGSAAFDDAYAMKKTAETVSVSARSPKTITFTIERPELPFYYLQITAAPAGKPSVFGGERALVSVPVRTTVPGAEILSLAMRPSGREGVFYGCFMGDTERPFTGRFAAVLKAKDGTVISELDHASSFRGTPQGIEAEFMGTPAGNSAVLQAALFDNQDRVVDEVTLRYDCSLFSPSPCIAEAAPAPAPSPAGGKDRHLFTLMAFFLFILVFATIVIIKRRMHIAAPPEPPRL